MMGVLDCLEKCELCPRKCGVNRLNGEKRILWGCWAWNKTGSYWASLF